MIINNDHNTSHYILKPYSLWVMLTSSILLFSDQFLNEIIVFFLLILHNVFIY